MQAIFISPSQSGLKLLPVDIMEEDLDFMRDSLLCEEVKKIYTPYGDVWTNKTPHPETQRFCYPVEGLENLEGSFLVAKEMSAEGEVIWFDEEEDLELKSFWEAASKRRIEIKEKHDS